MAIPSSTVQRSTNDWNHVISSEFHQCSAWNNHLALSFKGHSKQPHLYWTEKSGTLFPDYHSNQILGYGRVMSDNQYCYNRLGQGLVLFNRCLAFPPTDHCSIDPPCQNEIFYSGISFWIFGKPGFFGQAHTWWITKPDNFAILQDRNFDIFHYVHAFINF